MSRRINPRLPVHPFVDGRAPSNSTAQIGEIYGSNQPSFEHKSPTNELYKVSSGSGVKIGYKGHIPGGRHVIGTSVNGNVPISVCEPPPPPVPLPPRSALEVHRTAFRPARHVAQQEATLRQYRLQGTNRWAPFGVDTQDDPPATARSSTGFSTARSDYLTLPEEAHGFVRTLWSHANLHGQWGGYANVGERLKSTARPRSAAPHERLMRARAGRTSAGAVAAHQHNQNPVHHLDLSLGDVPACSCCGGALDLPSAPPSARTATSARWTPRGSRDYGRDAALPLSTRTAPNGDSYGTWSRLTRDGPPSSHDRPRGRSLAASRSPASAHSSRPMMRAASTAVVSV